MDKSFVTIENKMCVCCSKEFESGSLLLDRRMKKTFDMHTTTGYGLCPACKKDGFVLLIECDPTKSTIDGNTAKPSDAYKTGVVLYMKIEAFKKVFHDACGGEPPPFVYIEPDVTKKLKAMIGEE